MVMRVRGENRSAIAARNRLPAAWGRKPIVIIIAVDSGGGPVEHQHRQRNGPQRVGHDAEQPTREYRTELPFPALGHAVAGVVSIAAGCDQGQAGRDREVPEREQQPVPT
ncbi:hypothetical protein [Streptomyces sp. DT195]|uniref:hypothetical protein n=1 Tax=Streptomyces sp. DT195 TaxID=3393419 RepID=UPI003CEBBF21